MRREFGAERSEREAVGNGQERLRAVRGMGPNRIWTRGGALPSQQVRQSRFKADGFSGRRVAPKPRNVNHRFTPS